MQETGRSVNNEPESLTVEVADSEVQSLRRCIRDLAGLSALAAVWVGYDSHRLAISLADVLASTLDLHLVFVRVNSPSGGPSFDVVRPQPPDRDPSEYVPEIASSLSGWFDTESAPAPAAIANPIGSGTLNIAVSRIGHNGPGVLIAGSRRADFPTASERLLLSVAVNQAVVVLQQRKGEAERGQALAQEQRRALQLQRLAGASLAINSALSLPELLQSITDGAREVIGARQAVTSFNEPDAAQSIDVCAHSRDEAALSEDAEAWDGACPAALRHCTEPVRLTQDELQAHPAWRALRTEARRRLPKRGWLAAPLIGRSGRNLGLVQLSDKEEGEFTAEDAAILVQLAQVASVALENSRLHQQTQDTEQRLRVLVNSLNAILWEADPKTFRITFVSQRAETLLGYPSERWATPGFWASILHPDDREWAVARCQEATEQGQDYDLEYRVLAADGRVLWLHDIAYVLKDAAGKAVRVGGVMVDVTEWKRLDEQLRSSEEQFRTLVEQSPLSIQVLSPQGETLQVNRAWEQLWGSTLEQLHAIGYNMLRDGQLVEKGIMPYIQRGFAGEAVAIPPVEYDRTATLPHLFGVEEPRRWTRAQIYPVRDEANVIQKVVLIHEDYTARKLLEDALAQRVEELADSSRRKDEFLAMLAHELRNPLAPIRNAAHLLKLRSEIDPSLQRTQEIIERQVTHLTRLVDDLLDVARITRGHIELRRTELDLAELVSEAVESVRESMNSRGHRLSVQLKATLARLIGDRTRLVQVLSNLLANAAKYTPNGGRIDVIAEFEAVGAAPVIALRVRDNGQGIAPDLLPRIFDLFTQAARSLDRSEGGLGIGLTLVRELVEQHGGAIEVRSPGLGRGSEFVVRLPALPPSVETSAEGRRDQPASGPPKRILVVEDNLDAAATLTELLEAWGHEVRMVHDGPAAIAAASDLEPDVILLDIGLPQMDGYEVARQLRLQEDSTGAVIVALTGYAHDEQGAGATESRFDHRLVKPVDLDELQRLLAEIPPGADRPGWTTSAARNQC